VSREAIAPMLKDEIARAQKSGRTNLPTTLTEARQLLDEVRQRGAARVVDTLLPGIVGFCAPVFDSDGHIVLGIVAVGSMATFDPEWKGAVDKPLREAAMQLSSDLGWRG
jgi:DNA-binding IclR family transcriptional regulator